MTSEERHEARYQRRKAARMKKREEKIHEALDFDTVFTFSHLYRSALACYRGVSWKASVQAFKARGGIHVARRLRDLRNGIFKLKKSPEFTVRERGHERRINSIHIEDRVPQKCLCQYALKPAMHRSLIYDNYASQEGKGTSKARERLKCALERHIRRHGMTGGVILIDFRHYFDSIPHPVVRRVLDKHFQDRRIVGMNMKIVRQYREGLGLILGSENSQDFAISVPSLLDHYIKECLGIESYGRYMDDLWLIDPDYDHLRQAYEMIRLFVSKFGLQINEKKSRILRFGRPFSALKRKYSFTASGGIITRPVRETVIRERRKLKKLYHGYLKGSIALESGMDSVRAWESSIDGCKCHSILVSVRMLYTDLYIQRWLNGEEEQWHTKSPQGGRSWTLRSLQAMCGGRSVTESLFPATSLLRTA